ncbi:MAG: DUF5683 domain-containing protein [Bacteroidales bacterium]|jgi:hypothetical protein|nr:DUF5683 domain-containing protein [Bacteroidales bacterium]
MKLHFHFILLCSVLIFNSLPAHAQTDSTFQETPDSILEKRHSPTKATIMSACLPGLGQIYNRKIWKVPIIYAGFGVMAYFIYTNADEYINFKCAYIESSYGDRNGSYSDLVQKYSKDELLSAREYYRRNLEISCLITAVWYALNVLDATVDAHLFTFNISDKLALKVEPSWQPSGISHRPVTGMRLCLKF